MNALLNPQHKVSYDGVTLDVYHAKKGEGLPRHEHPYQHLTMCHSGSCVVRTEGKEVVVNKHTRPINLVAKEWHEIEALEDGTVFVNVFLPGKD